MKKFGYDRWFKTMSATEVSRLNDELSQKLEKRKSRILVAAVIGLILVPALIGVPGIAGWLRLVAFAAYFLGYGYCQTLWDIEKNQSEYFEALSRNKGDDIET